MKKIPGTENYYATESGFVMKEKNGKLLPVPSFVDKHGYLVIKVHNKNQFVHRMIATALVSNPDNKPHINHLNSNRQDNRPVNLEWCTPSENTLHAYREGNKKPTTHKPAAIITQKIADIIRAEHQAGTKVNDLVDKYGIKSGAVYKILNNKSWKTT